jgi:hypothetical protein
LNNQAALLQSIDTRDLSITVRAQGNSVSLDGTLLCQKPRFFKLVGKKLGSQEVLVGSNEERFWFYVKRDPSDALFHCSYTDFDKGVELPYPFEPEWVVEALGIGRFATMGASGGGPHALACAARFQDRVIGVVTLLGILWLLRRPFGERRSDEHLVEPRRVRAAQY